MVLAVLAGACSSDPGGCEEADLLTVPPVSESDYEVILPLGNLAPPGHTIPTDHIYYMLPREGEITREVEVRAPADIVITRVEETAHVVGGEGSFSDFSVTLSPCSDRILKFGHLTSITNAVRTAMGARRADIFRLLFVESLMLSALGGAVGLLLSRGLLRIVLGTVPVEFPFWMNFDPDIRVWAFAGLLVLLTGTVFGLQVSTTCSLCLWSGRSTPLSLD